MNFTIRLALLVATLLFVCVSLPSCLVKQIESPSKECLLSLNVQKIVSQQKNLACPLCIITEQKQLLQKSEEFCFYSKGYQQCAHKYFTLLILRGKIQQALQQDYEMFFKNPFQHNKILNKVLKQEKVVSALSNQQKQLQNITNLQSQTLLKLAILQFYLQKTEESRLTLNKYFQINNQTTSILYIKLLCRVLQKQTKYYDGLNFINQRIKYLQKIQIKDAYLYHLKGNFLMHHLKFRQAIKQFQKAIQLFATTLSYNSVLTFKYGFQISNYNIGLCYQKVNDPKMAIQYYQRVLKARKIPQAQPLNALGNAYVQLYQKQVKKQDLKKARYYYQQSLLKDSQYYLTYYNLGYLQLLQNKYEQALKMFQQTLILSPQTKNAKYGKLKAYLHLQKTEQVNKIVQQMIQQKKDQSTFVQIISILNQLGKNQIGLMLVSKYSQLIKSGESYQWKGMIQYGLDKYRQAKQSFETAIFKGSKSSHLYFNLGYCCQLLEQYQSALKYYAISNKIQKRQQTKNKVIQIQNLILEKAAANYGTKQVFQSQF